ncbi:RmlD substrate binding domain-containing protein, partial [Azospirillum brasilense]
MSTDSPSSPRAVTIIGGGGFIGRHLRAALDTAGHRVTAPGRADFDLVRDDAATLAAALAGQEVVINAAGLVRGRRGNSMEA